MSHFSRTLFAFLLVSLVSFTGFSQNADSKPKKEEIKKEDPYEGLRKIPTRPHPDMNFDIRVDNEELEAAIELAMKNAMKAVDVALESLEVTIEPIVINLADLNLDLDPIVINIPQLDINIEPIEMDMEDFDIEIEPIEIDLDDLNIEIDHDDFGWNDEENDEGDDEADKDAQELEKDKIKAKDKSDKDKSGKDKSSQKEKDKSKGLKKVN